MKIKIESDVFDIVKRIREIDVGYFIVFDTIKNRYEIHNENQNDSYCFSSKHENICAGMLDEVVGSNIVNIDNILSEIDNYNNNIELNTIKSIKNDSEYMLREIYKYSNNSSRDYDSKTAFSYIWS